MKNEPMYYDVFKGSITCAITAIDTKRLPELIFGVDHEHILMETQEPVQRGISDDCSAE